MREAEFIFGGSLPSNVGGLQARSFGRVRFSVNGKGVSWSSGNELVRSTVGAAASLGVMGIANVMIAMAIRNVTVAVSCRVNGNGRVISWQRSRAGLFRSRLEKKRRLGRCYVQFRV